MNTLSTVIVSVIGGGWAGVILYMMWQDYCEKKADERCNKTTLHKAYKVKIDHTKIIDNAK
jgi:hypothetical protein